MARSVAFRELPTGQLVVVKSGLFSRGKSVVDEKEESSNVVFKPWLLVALSKVLRTVLGATCKDMSLLQKDEV